MYENGYVTSYKIVAYDRKLECSAISDAAKFNANTENNVCKVGEIGYNSLFEATYAAKDGDTIYLFKNTSEVGVEINKNVTVAIAGDVTGNITLTRSGSGSFFVIAKGKSLTLQGTAGHKLILDGQELSKDDPFVSVSGTLIANYCIFQNIKSTGSGAAIWASSANITLGNCQFTACSTSANGGAIYLSSTPATISSCQFENCSAENGGAVYLESSTNVRLNSSSSISGCHATYGGGAYLKGSNFTIEGSSVIQQCTATDGGGIYITDGANLNFSSSTLSGNNASRDGGGVYVTGASNLSVIEGTISQNTAENNGGGICVASADSTLSLTGLAKINENTAARYGGAIASVGTITEIKGTDTIPSKNLSMQNNNAEYGGAIAVFDGGKISNIENLTLMANIAKYGGAIYLNGSANIDNAFTARDNEATESGGAIYYKGNENSELKFDSKNQGGKSILQNNSAPLAYGLYMESGNLKLLSVRFFFNYALAESMPTFEEQKYSLYVNGGNVTIQGNVGDGVRMDAELTRDIFISQNAEVTLTTAMFTLKEFTGPYDPNGIGVTKPSPLGGYYSEYSQFYLALDSYDSARLLFKTNFDITQDDISGITLMGAEYGRLAVKYNCVFYLPNAVEDVYRVEFCVDDNPVDTRYAFSGVKLIMPDLSDLDEGYELVGWCVGETCYKAGEEVEITGELTFVAKIAKIKFTVEYRNQDGVIESITVEYGDTITLLSSVENLPEGYEFLGWTDGERDYAVGEQITVTGNLTLVAKIAKIKLTVTYLRDNTNYDALQVEYGTEITLGSPDGLPEGREADYYLVNGVKHEVGDTIIITEATTINLITKAVSGDSQGGNNNQGGGDNQSGDNNQGGGDNQGGDNNQGGNDNPEVPLPGGGSGSSVGCNSGCNSQSATNGTVIGGISFLFMGGLWAMLKAIRRKRANQ